MRCQYNLRGLSVRSPCPECGLPIRATLLAVIDPHATEFQPIYAPRLTALGLVCWSAGALGAALMVWALRIGDAMDIWSSLDPLRTRSLPFAGLLMLLLSGLGALAFVRPHNKIPARRSLLALLGAALYIPLAWVFAEIHLIADPGLAPAYLEIGQVWPWRVGLRLIGAACLIGIILLSRPNARLIVARSMLFRLARVDRQTLLMLVMALCVAAAGDLLLLGSTSMGGGLEQGAWILGTVLVAVGSMLLTVGLVGVVLDASRMVPVLLEPAPSLVDVFGTAEQRESAER